MKSGKGKKLRVFIAGLLALCMAASGVVTSFGEPGGPGDSGLLWLVNYDHPVSSAYEAADMRAVSGGTQKMRGAAAAELEKMLKDMKAAGLSVSPVSGYRTYQRQNYLFTSRTKEKQNAGMSYEAAVAAVKMFTAAPGTSEHQLGLAMDFSTDGSLSQSFAGTKQGKWLAANSWKYGFVLRYASDKYGLTQIGNEPWHFRYVGKPHAQIMKERNWCLEEYISHLKNNGSITLNDGDYVYEIYRTAGSAAAYANVTDVSGDNSGGTIVTTRQPADPMKYIKGHWAESYFKTLLGETVPEKYGVIQPDRAITRGEFAALYGTMLPPAGNSGTGGFSDVPADHPYRAEIEAVAAAELMNGNGGRFRPQGLLTREEAAVAVAASVEGSKLQYLGYMDLGEISGWAFQSVQKLAYHQIMGGSGGNFRPKATLTWGEAAALLCRLQEQQKQQGSSPERDTNKE